MNFIYRIKSCKSIVIVNTLLSTRIRCSYTIANFSTKVKPTITIGDIDNRSIKNIVKKKGSIGGVFKDPTIVEDKEVKQQSLVPEHPCDETGGEMPKQPEVPTNCCGSGCSNCVWDTYYEQMDEYNKKLKILDPYAEEVPPDTSNNDEDPMQFFLKMEKYIATKQKKAKLIKEEQEKSTQQQTGISDDNNNNVEIKS